MVLLLIAPIIACAAYAKATVRRPISRSFPRFRACGAADQPLLGLPSPDALSTKPSLKALGMTRVPPDCSTLS